MDARPLRQPDAFDPVLSRLTPEQIEQLADLLAMLADEALADDGGSTRDPAPLVGSVGLRPGRSRARRA